MFKLTVDRPILDRLEFVNFTFTLDDVAREAALIERCAAGEQSACAELVAGHERMVFQLAFHLLGDQEEARDLSQDVFLQVFRTIERFRGQSALRTWMYRIVVNQARGEVMSTTGANACSK